jgi:hypothetical protein
MTPAELREIGIRLYGERWQTALARELGVNPRTVRRWASGDSPIMKPMARAIRQLNMLKETDR